MTFNVLLGGEDRFGEQVKLLQRLSPDILVLQECLYWEDGERLRQCQQALGAAHAHLGFSSARGSGKHYHLAAFSKLPIEHVRTYSDPRWLAHSLLELDVEWEGEPLRIYGAHFTATSENLRFVEARYLMSQLPHQALSHGRVLLLGDLNAMSPRDPYPADLDQRLAQARVDKFHHPPRFDVLPHLEEHGWVDTLHAQGAPGSWVSAPRDRGGVRIDYRTDYVLASQPMAERLQRSWVEPLERQESDHYPALAEFA